MNKSFWSLVNSGSSSATLRYLSRFLLNGRSDICFSLWYGCENMRRPCLSLFQGTAFQCCLACCVWCNSAASASGQPLSSSVGWLAHGSATGVGGRLSGVVEGVLGGSTELSGDVEGDM